jgi:hypothetical protein
MDKVTPGPSESRSDSRVFLIGKDTQGNWIAQDTRGQYGGLFVNRAEALRFALFENGHRPQAVMMVPGVLELDMSQK